MHDSQPYFLLARAEVGADEEFVKAALVGKNMRNLGWCACSEGH